VQPQRYVCAMHHRSCFNDARENTVSVAGGVLLLTEAT
jgi:hypothetical protein